MLGAMDTMYQRGKIQGDGAHLQAATSLSALQATARDRKNVFAALMEAVKTHSLGQISHALYEVGGEYRRNM
jgi:methylmalonyl-CoA mutase